MDVTEEVYCARCDRAHQRRERPVACSRCHRSTWQVHGLCADCEGASRLFAMFRSKPRPRTYA